MSQWIQIIEKVSVETTATRNTTFQCTGIHHQKSETDNKDIPSAAITEMSLLYVFLIVLSISYQYQQQ